MPSIGLLCRDILFEIRQGRRYIRQHPGYRFCMCRDEQGLRCRFEERGLQGKINFAADASYLLSKIWVSSGFIEIRRKVSSLADREADRDPVSEAAATFG